MQIDRRKIESSLCRKGFVKEDDDHKYFHHEYEGKRTGISTFTSHGSHYKVYTDSLLKMMKKQLRLDTMGQLWDLLDCPMDGDDYNQILRGKRLI